MKFSIEEIVSATGAKIIKNKISDKGYTFSTDTRTIERGQIYIPLKGTNFDGENFLEQAIEKGASGCFITKDAYPENTDVVLKVTDTLNAYMKLAKFKREKLNPITIGITGSSGKTDRKSVV